MRYGMTAFIAISAGLLAVLAPASARGQGIAFVPGVGTLPDGVNMNVTPAVSADRRYVRIGVNFGSQTVNGLTTLNIPVGAVSGGPSGFAGMNGPIGGLGPGGAAGGGFVLVPSAPPVMTAASLGFAAPRTVPRSKRLREKAKAKGPVKPEAAKSSS